MATTELITCKILFMIWDREIKITFPIHLGMTKHIELPMRKNGKSLHIGNMKKVM